MEEYYTIQTPGHYNNIFIELHTLQKQGVLCDVVLMAEDGEVMAHKVVLMAVSKYFRDKLSPVLGLNPTKICLKGISVVELANLIQYIYTGKLLVAKESMDVILEISEILGLNGVVQGYKEIILYEERKRQKGKSIPCKTYTHHPASSVESTMTSSSATPVVTEDSNSTVVASSTTQSSTAEEHQNADQVVTKNSVDRNPNVIQADNSDEVIESVNQSIAADYNFGALYDQQYVDVTAGTNSPLKNSPACGSQSKHPVKSSVSAACRNIAEEEAQHQDLLTVAIETLSDAPYLKQQGQPELEKAVMSISCRGTADSVANLDKPMAENTVDVEPFVNGRTNTKTFTMSAGTVNNDLGGKTDVYTVSLDPLSVKTPLVMPRPKRSKTQKEKDAEEKARMYRQKKAQILQSDLKDIITEKVSSSSLKTEKVAVLDGNDGRARRNRNTTQNQDFQYESLSKTKKKAFVPRVVFSEEKVNKTDHVNGEKIVDVVDTEELANRQKADDFAQVVNFDSDDDDDNEVNGMIANDIVGVMNNTSDSEPNTRTKGVYVFTKGKNINQSQNHTETKNQPKTNTNRNNQTDNATDLAEVTELLDTGAPEKYMDNSDVSMSQKRHSDDEATEKMRSSALKRKTRTPKKVSCTDSENNDCNRDKQELIPMVRTMTRSMCLNEVKDLTEIKVLKINDVSHNRSVGNELNSNSNAATSLHKDNEHTGAMKASGFMVSKSLMPEVRLKKHSPEEILQIAKDCKKNKMFSTNCTTDKACETGLIDGKTPGDLETAVSLTTKKVNSNRLKRKLADEPDVRSTSKARHIDVKGFSNKDNFCEEASDSSIFTRPSGDQDVEIVDEFIEPTYCDGAYVCKEKGTDGDMKVVEQTTDSVEEDNTNESMNVGASDDGEQLPWENVRLDANTDEILCPKCLKTFKTPNLMKKHYIATHSDKQFKCTRCDYVARVKSNLNTHMKLKHSLPDNDINQCRFCSYGSVMLGNLKNHILHAHGLIMVTSHIRNSNEKFYDFNDGDIVTLDGKLFDPKLMPLPKNRPRTFQSRRTLDKKTNTAQHRISLFKLPVNEFVKEVLKRHEEFLKQPEKDYSYMCNSIAKATEQPSFPQASPQIRNNHANKVYNMQKMKLPVQEPSFQGYVTNQVGIPGVDNEVEVTQHDYPENVESGESNGVLTISERTNGNDGEEMIIINQSGKQTVVRSKDFYDTLSASGHDSNQTLEVIAALLQAGEQIEIREQCEQEDYVEIQNA